MTAIPFQPLPAELDALPPAIKLKLCKAIACVAEQAYRRGVQQGALYQPAPETAYKARFTIPYNEHPIYVGRGVTGIHRKVVWARSSLHRLEMEAQHASPLIGELLDSLP